MLLKIYMMRECFVAWVSGELARRHSEGSSNLSTSEHRPSTFAILTLIHQPSVVLLQQPFAVEPHALLRHLLQGFPSQAAQKSFQPILQHLTAAPCAQDQVSVHHRAQDNR